MDELSLYIHIPFCKKKCLYCDFPSFDNINYLKDDYVNSLINEIKEGYYKYGEYKIKSIFIGGGTPTTLSVKHLGKIMDTLLTKYNIVDGAEITIESNPGTLEKNMALELKCMDINRVSIGLQAWQDSILKNIGRIHTKDEFIKSYFLLRDVGFKNINVDLMFSLPSQTLYDLEETIEKVTYLNPEHISCYSLIVEEGTPLSRMINNNIIKAPDEILDRDMYNVSIETLENKGYNRYEISNFAKKGLECRHNETYWKCEEYIGFGLGSHSYKNGTRYSNTYDMGEYIRNKGLNVIKESEDLSQKNMMSEFMFMGLRMCEGINKNLFKKRFNIGIHSVYKEIIGVLKHEGLLLENQERIYLTNKGIDVSNYVFEKFLAD